jgi:hypothetical protein
MTDLVANDKSKYFVKSCRLRCLIGMSKKAIVIITVALVTTLAIVSIALHPLPKPKRHAARIATVNNICAPFGLTTRPGTNQLPVLKP